MIGLTSFRLSLLCALAIASPAIARPLQAGPAPAAPAAKPVLDAAARKALIDQSIAKLTERYVFPDKVPMIAKALRASLASGKYNTKTDPEAFVAAVNADIAAVANDKHLNLFWSPYPLPPFDAPDKLDPEEARKRNAFLASRNYAMRKVESLDGNIGYLKINGFLPPADAGATLAAAMAFLAHSDALIFDLRENGGGEPSMVAMVLSYLVPPDTLINSFHQRGKAVDDQVWAFPYVPGGRWSTDKPVYVLTSSKTASGAEEMAYDIQQLKRGTVVGEVTWGGANPGDFVALDKHYALFVPTGMAVNPVSKTNWEGVGVKPDVAVPAADALDKAYRMALQKLAETATGPRRDELQALLAPAAKK